MKNNKFLEIIPGKVYASQGKAISGEDIYFGVERVEKDVNYKQWTIYLQQSQYKSQFYLSKMHASEESRANHAEKLGFTKDSPEYNKICDSIIKHTTTKTDDQLYKMVSGVAGALGASGFRIDGEYFISYVSKKPIDGYYQHPAECITLKGYHEGYKDLLMTVRSVPIDDTVVFNNRGICKSLDAIVNGGYSGLSMLLHKATGECFSEYYGKTHLSVEPLPMMYKIMRDSLPEGSVLVGEKIPADLKHFKDSSGLNDTPCVVSIKTLSEYAQNKEEAEEQQSQPIESLIGGVGDDLSDLKLSGEEGSTEEVED